VSNYYTFLQQLANSIGTTIINVAVTDISYQTASTSTLAKIFSFSKAQINNVVVTGQLSTSATSNSAQANSEYASLNSFLSSSTIASMTASQKNVAVNGGEVNNNGNNNNNNDSSSGLSQTTIIILATVIPICAVRTFPPI
jgi:hypothetical protein